jgi:hypothetical protein
MPVLIPSSHLHVDLPNGLYPTGFTIKIINEFVLVPIRAACPTHSGFDHPNNVCEDREAHYYPQVQTCIV